ncbi:PREDICTED: carcinoembryonic antigen-related cell adhesion molecule 16-like, partial [Gekko japonicus]|uniref:Carcinoembryonic antigen-related cell adhesion molecule 16-like n=1 Tax=Gekko japonicus TaxID=146911 RepID=A0ABM1JPN3_GEKJA
MGRQAEGPPWASPGRLSSWQAALLAATILSSCFRLTQAQEIPVTVEPAKPLEGQDVTLTPEGKPTFIACDWYRGEQAEPSRIFTYVPSSPPDQQNGPGFTGRETGGPGCSLRIGNLMLNDTGDYIVSKIVTGSRETGRVPVGVLELLTKPSVSAFPSPFLIESTGSVNLTCETTSKEVSISWFYNGEPLNSSSRIQVSEDNRTVVIKAAT